MGRPTPAGSLLCLLAAGGAALRNTFGGFARIVNPSARDIIDTLVIRLTNPPTACCSNPMGLDNIVVAY